MGFDAQDLHEIVAEEEGDGSSAPTEETTQLPSIGSAKHATGECKPCWFHPKPTGCDKGLECLHCHLCTSEDIRSMRREKCRTRHINKKLIERARRKYEANEKRALASQTLAPSCASSWCTESPELKSHTPDSQEIVAEEKDDGRSVPTEETHLPSVGSAKHSSGGCKPCWFHAKPTRCNKASECPHCPLCTFEDIQALRREKFKNRSDKRKKEVTREEFLASQTPARNTP